jgi:hypothetical protein
MSVSAGPSKHVRSVRSSGETAGPTRGKRRRVLADPGFAWSGGWRDPGTLLTVDSDSAYSSSRGADQRAHWIKIGRKDNPQAQTTAFSIGIRYETTLTYLVVKTLYSHRPRFLEGDVIWNEFQVDYLVGNGDPKTSCGANCMSGGFAWVEETSHKLPLQTRRFDQWLVPNLYAVSALELFSGEGFYLFPWMKNYSDSSPDHQISPLDPQSGDIKEGSFRWCPDESCESWYYYVLKYQLSHEQEQ